jgi:hypothetical protein
MRAAVSIAALVTAIVGSSCGDGSSPGRADSLVLPRLPYVGVSCPVANTVRCDRVGVAVWLDGDDPARRVEAWIEGRRLRLVERRAGTFEGFLEPAGLSGGAPDVSAGPDGRWLGVPPVRVRLRVVAHDGDRRSRARTVVVPLHAGWG